MYSNWCVIEQKYKNNTEPKRNIIKNLIELINIAPSEEKLEQFLRANGILKTIQFCPFCGGNSVEMNYHPSHRIHSVWARHAGSIQDVWHLYHNKLACMLCVT